ncbi:MAG: hypothetical protein NC923_03145 [Candidatus Omnitrophica bacterium]|nr:hypothetical protein [Candidatus Omnitrophota bacterium]
MKNTCRKTLIAVLMLIFICGIAYAKDSFSIPVSCSIPAVPGLNAPIAENKSKAQATSSKQTLPASAKEETKYIMQQDTTKKVNEKEKSKSAPVTSIYGR